MSRIDTPNPKAERLLIEGWARGFSALGGLAGWLAQRCVATGDAEAKSLLTELVAVPSAGAPKLRVLLTLPEQWFSNGSEPSAEHRQEFASQLFELAAECFVARLGLSTSTGIPSDVLAAAARAAPPMIVLGSSTALAKGSSARQQAIPAFPIALAAANASVDAQCANRQALALERAVFVATDNALCEAPFERSPAMARALARFQELDADLSTTPSTASLGLLRWLALESCGLGAADLPGSSPSPEKALRAFRLVLTRARNAFSFAEAFADEGDCCLFWDEADFDSRPNPHANFYIWDDPYGCVVPQTFINPLAAARWITGLGADMSAFSRSSDSPRLACPESGIVSFDDPEAARSWCQELSSMIERESLLLSLAEPSESRIAAQSKRMRSL